MLQKRGLTLLMDTFRESHLRGLRKLSHADSPPPGNGERARMSMDDAESRTFSIWFDRGKSATRWVGEAHLKKQALSIICLQVRMIDTSMRTRGTPRLRTTCLIIAKKTNHLLACSLLQSNATYSCLLLSAVPNSGLVASRWRGSCGERFLVVGSGQYLRNGGVLWLP